MQLELDANIRRSGALVVMVGDPQASDLA